MFKYYQSICLMFVKDSALLKNNPEQAKFVEVNKNDWTKQEEVVRIVNEARLRETLSEAMEAKHIF